MKAHLNIVINLGTDKDSPSASDIFATKKNITRNEFFMAKQAGLKPALFVEIRTESYSGEEYLWHSNKRYKICNGKYCDGTYGSYGVSYGLVLLILRLEEEVKILYGPDAELRLTDDIGRNGGLRCELWNKACNGAKYSPHRKWLAADLIVVGVRDVNYIIVQQLGDKINPYGGCSEKYYSNIHLDSRGKWARW